MSYRVQLLSTIGVRVNPYIGLLAEGLEAAGAQVTLTPRLDPTHWRGAERPDVLHLHWLERFAVPPPITLARWRGARAWPLVALRRAVERAANQPAIHARRRRAALQRLFDQLRAFQAEGGRVAFTVHNLQPHEGADPVEAWGLAQMVRIAHVVHVHDAATAAGVTQRFGRTSGLAVIPHGHYITRYPNTITRAAARQQFGIPDEAFTFVFLGLLRPYKGLETLLPAFRRLPGDQVRLLLAGEPNTPGYLAQLASLARGDERIRFHPALVPAEAVQTFFNAADVCVLPYRQITTSGAALLAFSFGLPVIAPALGAFPELITARRGLLYDPAAADGLLHALAQARATDWRGASAEIMGWVSQFDWALIGARLLQAYRGG